MLLRFYNFDPKPEGHRKRGNKVESLSSIERPVGFEQGSFQF